MRAARLADWLGVTPATVAVAVRKIAQDGLIAIAPTKTISLTHSGRAAAARVVRTHRIAERWLTDVVGMDWAQADEEAAALEHAISDDLAERLFEMIGRPNTCPHGNPIPGTTRKAPPERALSSLALGARARVSRISEVAEHEAPELLRFLADHGLLIGVELEVLDVSLGAGTQTVLAGARTVVMSSEVARKIWVE